jgi:uncharacterized SAM-dependent methyltransferase
MMTETSAKFRIDGIRDELAAVDPVVIGSWMDSGHDFALTLARAAR